MINQKDKIGDAIDPDTASINEINLKSKECVDDIKIVVG